MRTGQDTESLFYNLFRNRDIQGSTKEEDMYKHIDYYVDGISYEVKSEKKMNRWDGEASPDIIWIEAKNVRGNLGWLFGEADKIAFLIKDKFAIVDRQKLVDFVKEFVGSGHIYDEKQYRKWYRRKGRMDAVTYVYTSDIEHLIEKTYTI